MLQQSRDHGNSLTPEQLKPVFPKTLAWFCCSYITSWHESRLSNAQCLAAGCATNGALRIKGSWLKHECNSIGLFKYHDNCTRCR